MCTWGGYIGTERAASVLLEMGRRQEGLWSGFFSGIATPHDGELHCDKVAGSMDRLTSSTNAAALPGNAGLIHSRTGGYGDREWAHPFVSRDLGVALVGQGRNGRFEDEGASRIGLGNAILDAGCSLRSAVPDRPPGCPTLRNGLTVHTAELTMLGVGLEYRRIGRAAAALRSVISKIPTESVVACMFRDEPKTLYIANVNQRTIIGRDNSGVYAATSRLAFPDDVSGLIEVPSNTIAAIRIDTQVFEPLSDDPKFAVDETFPAGLDQAFQSYVARHPGTHLADVVDKALGPLFSGRGLERRSAAGHQTLERLLDAGRVRIDTGYAAGAEAPRCFLYAT